jgi:hypothetical protein
MTADGTGCHGQLGPSSRNKLSEEFIAAAR